MSRSRTSIYADPTGPTAAAAPVAAGAAGGLGLGLGAGIGVASNGAALRRITRSSVASASAAGVTGGAGAAPSAAGSARTTLGDITNRPRTGSAATKGGLADKSATAKPTEIVKPTALRRTTTLSATLTSAPSGSGSGAAAASSSAVPALTLTSNGSASSLLSRTATAGSLSGALSARTALPELVKPKAKVPSVSGLTADTKIPSRPSSAQPTATYAFDKENLLPNNANANANATATATATAKPSAAAAGVMKDITAQVDSKQNAQTQPQPQVSSAAAPPGGSTMDFEVGDDDDAQLSARTQKLALYANVDDVDLGDAQNVADYIVDIHSYFKATETRRMPSATYMSRQTDLNANMREKLIDWLVDVALKFKLRTETLYLCVNYLDRFLERQSTAKTRLQLVGMVAMLIATKYEEIYVPEIEDFVYICARAFTRQQLLEMECAMLQVLEFNLTIPTPLRFMQRYCRLANANDTQSRFATYLCETTLQEYKMLRYVPSCIGAACVYLARWYTNPNAAVKPWTPVLAAHSEFAETDPVFVACIRDVHAIAANTKPKYMAVRRKYSDKAFGAVAATIKPVTPSLLDTAAAQ